ncbi:uncharacterized protein LOC142488368 isoform X2 [Ascaphus truei]|uniref:uncharacterized protein LOC142488368 isoform X2 n=1 Tax=Ascaphus truei TaxID=8439 RepID=UPI003F59AC20
MKEPPISTSRGALLITSMDPRLLSTSRGALPKTNMDPRLLSTFRGTRLITSMDPRLLSFPVVVLERLEIKSETEEADTEDNLTTIKSEIDSFPVGENGLNEEQNWSSDMSRSCLAPRLPRVSKNNEYFRMLDMQRDPVAYHEYRMDNSSIERMISEVYRREPLWNQRTRAYHNRFIHEKLWQEVGDIFSITSDVAKKKWKILRHTFGRELKRPKPPRPRKAGTRGRKHSAPWRFFQSMLFLKDQILPTLAESNLLYTSCKREANLGTSLALTKVENSLCDSAISTEPQPQKRPSSECTSQVIPLEGKKLEMIKNVFTAKSDEDLDFFKTLLPHMKGMDPVKKLNIRNEIQSVVLRAAQKK